MKKAALLALLFTATLAVPVPSYAHHSFAVWDLEKNIPFEGVVDTLNFRNPHMSMTLLVTEDGGQQKKVEFSEGAPANMLIRMGMRPDMIKPGTKIKVIGCPRKDNPNIFFLKAITLADGKTFNVLGRPKPEDKAHIAP